MSKEKTYLIKLLGKLQDSKIHWNQSTSWSRQNDEGYNDGIQLAISQIEKRIKYLTKSDKGGVKEQ